ncbi:MAG: hypothetical protein ACREH9_01805 [Pseudomonadota bacterium]
MQQVFPSMTSRTGFTQAAYDWCAAAVAAGYLPDYEPGVLAGSVAQFTGGTQGCGTQKASLKTQLVSTAGAGALTVGIKMLGPSAAIPGGAIAAGVVIGVGAVLEGIGAIFGHHAAAVAKERGTLCSAVPMADAALEQLDQWLAAGQITATTYSQALDATDANFEAEVKPITDQPIGANEAGGYVRALRGIVARRKLDLQNVQAAGGVEALSLQTGIPPTVMIVGAGLLVWFLLS